MSKWNKKGYARLSKSARVLVLALEDLHPRRFIIDIEKLFHVIAGWEQDVDILEGENQK
jgi:hypothetical protein